MGQKSTERSGSKDRVRSFEAVVMGVSAGGLDALQTILPALPVEFPLPILIVQHRHPDSDEGLSRVLNEASKICVKEAEEGEFLEAGTAYLAPPNYHVLVERDHSLVLTVDDPVNHARPSVDVLFESAADVFRDRLIGVILTGAGCDGAKGLYRIHALGGLTVVQDPSSALIPSMPQAALTLVPAVDYCVPLREIAPLLLRLVAGKSSLSHDAAE